MWVSIFAPILERITPRYVPRSLKNYKTIAKAATPAIASPPNPAANPLTAAFFVALGLLVELVVLAPPVVGLPPPDVVPLGWAFAFAAATAVIPVLFLQAGRVAVEEKVMSAQL
jgi:hypothetical protein